MQAWAPRRRAGEVRRPLKRLGSHSLPPHSSPLVIPLTASVLPWQRARSGSARSGGPRTPRLATAPPPIRSDRSSAAAARLRREGGNGPPSGRPPTTVPALPPGPPPRCSSWNASDAMRLRPTSSST